jgi:hypothetical protein
MRGSLLFAKVFCLLFSGCFAVVCGRAGPNLFFWPQKNPVRETLLGGGCGDVSGGPRLLLALFGVFLFAAYTHVFGQSESCRPRGARVPVAGKVVVATIHGCFLVPSVVFSCALGTLRCRVRLRWPKPAISVNKKSTLHHSRLKEAVATVLACFGCLLCASHGIAVACDRICRFHCFWPPRPPKKIFAYQES